MPTDLLVLAGEAAAALERHGFIACGRRENGETRVDFWTRHGTTYPHHQLSGTESTVEEIVAACLAVAKSAAQAPKAPPSNRVLN